MKTVNLIACIDLKDGSLVDYFITLGNTEIKTVETEDGKICKLELVKSFTSTSTTNAFNQIVPFCKIHLSILTPEQAMKVNLFIEAKDKYSFWKENQDNPVTKFIVWWYQTL
jgi:hypothetical protein